MEQTEETDFEKSLGRWIENNEIVIEDISEEEILKVQEELSKAGYHTEYWKAGKQESGHLHIKDIPHLETLDKNQLKTYKELFIKKYVPHELQKDVDFQLCGKHRIAEENRQHYKGYGIKSLVKEVNIGKLNFCDKELFDLAKQEARPLSDTAQFEELINQVSPYWIEGRRQELALNLSGYLRKEKRLGIENVKAIIFKICSKAKDNEVQMRLKAVEETFKKDEAEIKGYTGLKDVVPRNVLGNMSGKEVKEIKNILLPSTGKLVSEFADEVGEILAKENVVFYRPSSRDILEIGFIKDKDKEEEYTGFIQVEQNRFITICERYFIPSIQVRTQLGTEIYPKSMGGSTAKIVLCSSNLQEALPKIKRLFTIPLPILYKGELTFPNKGYDSRFESWLSPFAPEIKTDMPLKEAKEVIEKVFCEFCFQTQQDYTNAVAGLITPFLRGLFNNFSTRTPIFFYIANRERAGKDFCAGITGIVYEGNALDEPPVSNSEGGFSGNNDELRKKLLASLIAGRKRLHFANNKGFIDNAVLEAILTSEKYSDRPLGRSEMLTFENELDFSMSGNVGVTYTPDFANRAKFIRLFLGVEDANSRHFNNPQLHSWVKENRWLILSALYSLVRNWFDTGKKCGSIPFTSYPDWANVCGGIMESAGYDNPCQPDKDALALGGDAETKDMKVLFEVCYEKFGNQWVSKQDIRNLVMTGDDSIFGYLDFNKKSDQIKFGQKVIKFTGRTLSNIRLKVQDTTVRASRQLYMFTKEVPESQESIFGNVGNVCNVLSSKKLNEDKLYKGISTTEIANIAKNLVKFTVEELKQAGFTEKEMEEYQKDNNNNNNLNNNLT